ncbi:MAG: hypothetical protein CL858_08970 [Cupriavidus sp.]|nr:hypothetical protein [Cupriavidus sp.]
MVSVEDLYAAAANAGLLVEAEVDGQIVMVDFRAPDETVLDGLALSTDYTMRFLASALPDLGMGQVVSIGGTNYRVRDVRAIGDGSERRADLTRI